MNVEKHSYDDNDIDESENAVIFRFRKILESVYGFRQVFISSVLSTEGFYALS